MLAGVTAARAAREQAERDQVCRVVEWAVTHQVAPDREQPDEDDDVFAEPCLALAGPGAPRVGEYAAMELAAALGLATDTGLDYLGNALEVRYRLPRLWARLAAGEAGGLTVWRAFRIAAQTRVLCASGAAEVDARLAGFAHQVGAAQIDRTVSAAMAAHDPDTTARLAAEAADARHFAVHLGGPTPADRQGLAATAGVVKVTGLLDLADAGPSVVEPGEPLGESESRPRTTTGHRSRSPHQASTRSVAASSLGRGHCSTTDERVR